MELYEEIIIFLVGLLIFMKIRPQLYSKFELHFTKSSKNLSIIENCPSIKCGRFYPTFYLSLGLLQAIFGSKSRHTEDCVKFRKEYIIIPNYGEFGIDWAYSDDKSFKRPLKVKKMICIFPGLVSSINEPYIINILAESFKRGFEVCLLNDRFYTNRDEKQAGRGISFSKDGPFKFVDDYKQILDKLKEQYEGYTFYAIGHSFGANTLTKYIGQYHKENIFSGAVCASNPWDFFLGSKYLTKTMDSFLVQSRLKIIKQFRNVFEKNKPSYVNYNYDDLLQATDCRDLDTKFTSKLLGYTTVDQYYKGISCIHEIEKIQVPALFLQSKDDPILNEDTIPKDEIKLNPNLIMIVTNTGGHVGWFEGFINPRRWYIKPALEFIEHLDKQNSVHK